MGPRAGVVAVALAIGVHQLLGVPGPVALLILGGVLLLESVIAAGVLLPGATAVLLSGALAGWGGVPLLVSGPVLTVVVLIGDHAAFALGHRLRAWNDRRRKGSAPAARGQAGRWASVGLAAYPSVAGASGQPYRTFLPRLLVLRGIWLPTCLFAGNAAARSLGSIQQVGTILGVAGAVGLVGVLLVHRGRARRRRSAVAAVEDVVDAEIGDREAGPADPGAADRGAADRGAADRGAAAGAPGVADREGAREAADR